MLESEISLQVSPFSDDFVDVAALNARVSTFILERVEAVRQAALRDQQLPSKAIAVLGAAGGGKTHLFARLRHQAGPRPTLILLRPYFGVNLSLRDVLAVIVDQLCLPVQGGPLTQLDVLTAHWLRDGNDVATASASESTAGTERVERGVKAIVSRIPEIAPAAHLVRALLQVGEREPSAAWGELAWLSGREPRAIGESASSAALSERDVLHVLRILSVLAAPVAPLVLTFDQLENLAGDDEARVLSYGNLVGEIVDSLPSFTVVQLALTSEWVQFIEPRLSLPQKTRVAGATFVLDGPDRKERELLLRAWHEQFLARGMTTGRRKRFPSPLSAEELDVLLGAPGMTPRLLLASLSRAMSGQPMAPVSPTASPGSLGKAGEVNATDASALWSAETSRVSLELDEKERANVPVDAGELAEGLASALSFVPRLDVTTRTERDRILTSVKAPGHELVLLYLTSLHHASVGSTLAKAAEIAQNTKVVVVRERRFDFPSTWETVHERRSIFERLPNARWLWLEREEVARCLSLARLLSRARAKRLELPGSHKPLSLAQARDELQRAQSPDSWQSVTSIARWLTDVPRETAAPATLREPGRTEARASVPPAAPVAPAPSVPLTAPFAPVSELRGWLSMGRALGVSTVRHYVGKVRALVGRDDD